MYLSIVKTENNRITKFLEFQASQGAQSHATEYGGFVYNNSNNDSIRDLWVEGQTVTVVPIIDPVPPKIYAPIDFFERFTKDERKAIRTAAKSNDDLEDWLDMLKVTGQVDTSSQRTIDGMAALVAGGLLSQQRSDEILS